MRQGQDLVAAGYAGLAGTGVIIQRKGQELEKRFSARYLDSVLCVCRQSEADFKKAGRNIFTPWDTEMAAAGGILTAIWNLSGSHRLGVEFSLRRIPVLQGTIEICEQFGLNPYRLYSKTCSVLAVDNGGQIVERLDKERIPAAVIGRITGGIARLVTDNKEQGYLNRPQPDELEKIIPDWKDFIKRYKPSEEAVNYERKDFSSY